LEIFFKHSWNSIFVTRDKINQVEHIFEDLEKEATEKELEEMKMMVNQSSSSSGSLEFSKVSSDNCNASNATS